MALTCHFSLDVLISPSGLSGTPCLQFFLTDGQCLSTVAALLDASPIKEGLQLHGEGCDGRLIQIS